MASPSVGTIDNPPFKKNLDIYVAVGLIGILALMILPVPSFLLDLFLALNITISLAILLVGLYTSQPLDFSIFPSLLLITTLFRLALNIASMKLILLHGNEGTEAAGAVIRAFGQFVVGGNYVVGIIAFLILVIINFTVITKGSGRVAEVAARFTLDAMPGKQMAIDADHNAGHITFEEAKEKRDKVSREADFYGAMDGASKFVRGDAIAAILIMLVNIVGGLVIGVFQMGMPVETAMGNYCILTIGEGLMSQIPALIISTTAGIIVTRSADEKDFGTEMSGQFLHYPKAFFICSGILAAFGLIPGLPHIAFFVLSGVCYLVGKVAREVEIKREKAPTETTEEAKIKDDPYAAVGAVDLIELEVGYALVPLIDTAQSGELLERINSIRMQFAQKFGFIVPSVHIHDNLQLKPYEYNVLIKGAKIGGGELNGQCLAMDSGGATGDIGGAKTIEPVFGLPATWISEEDKEEAQMMGYTVVDPTTIIATHINEIIRKHASELIGRQELQYLLDNLSRTCPKVVEDLVPNTLSLGIILRVVKNLLREQVSIRDLRTILETLADYGVVVKDADTLTEFVRQAMSRTIVDQYKLEDSSLCLINLDHKLEEAILSSIQPSDQGGYLTLQPAMAQKIIGGINQKLVQFDHLGASPVLLATPSIRRYVKRLTERYIPSLAVLSHNEIPSNIKIQSLGVVTSDAS